MTAPAAAELGLLEGAGLPTVDRAVARALSWERFQVLLAGLSRLADALPLDSPHRDHFEAAYWSLHDLRFSISLDGLRRGDRRI